MTNPHLVTLTADYSSNLPETRQDDIAMQRVSKPRILIAMIEVGSGHKAPAMALKAGLERLYPGSFDIDVLDFMKEVGDIRLDEKHKASWNWMLEHPGATYAMQNLIDRAVPVSLTRWVQGKMLTEHAKHAGKFVNERGYDLLTATHFMPLQSLAMAKKQGGIKAPLVGINTDPFEGHALWAERHMDELIVSSDQSRKLLVQKGVPEEKVRIFGYPLGLAFQDVELDQAAARRQLGLSENRLTVLQSAGGEGLGGQLERFVDAVLKADLDMQYVIACGRNEALYERLRERATQHQGKTTLLPQGFITNMQSWIVASDLVLGKAGAASTFEPLALNRPIFHTSYVAPNEKRNLDFCIAQGIGQYLPKPDDLVRTLRPLTLDRQPLAKLAAKIEALNLQPGTLDIARHLTRQFIG